MDINGCDYLQQVLKNFRCLMTRLYSISTLVLICPPLRLSSFNGFPLHLLTLIKCFSNPLNKKELDIIFISCR